MQTLVKNGFIMGDDLMILDFDWCVIVPMLKSNKHPTSSIDWQISRANVVDVLRTKILSGYSLIFFNEHRAFLEDNIECFAERYNIPFMAIIVNDVRLLKPSRLSIPYRLNNRSFFVSNIFDENLNREFCRNLGIGMISCGKLFMDDDIKSEFSDVQEIVVMVGYPGAGKTTYALKHFNTRKDCVVLHGDELGSKLLRRMREELLLGRSVVIDATNPSRSCRQQYVRVANERDISIRCVHINTDNYVAFRRNMNRPNRVPSEAFRSYTRRFDAPSMDEGFKNISIIK